MPDRLASLSSVVVTTRRWKPNDQHQYQVSISAVRKYGFGGVPNLVFLKTWQAMTFVTITLDTENIVRYVTDRLVLKTRMVAMALDITVMLMSKLAVWSKENFGTDIHIVKLPVLQNGLGELGEVLSSYKGSDIPREPMVNMRIPKQPP
jgi:hypothetical protein